MDENIEKITKNLQVTTIEVNRENVTRKQFLGWPRAARMVPASLGCLWFWKNIFKYFNNFIKLETQKSARWSDFLFRYRVRLWAFLPAQELEKEVEKLKNKI